MPNNVDVVEALLFASDTPLEAERIREVLDLGNAEEARGLVRELTDRYEHERRSLQIVEAGGGYRMVTRPEMAPWLVRLARARTRVRMSRPALETLAIVAYKQPVSRPEIDAARGVNSEGVLENLLERRLVRIAGRKEAPGRPFLFETTREFLVAFGLRDLGDLPKVEGELVLPDLAAPASDDGAEHATDTEGTAVARASGTEGPAATGGPEDPAANDHPGEHADTAAEQDPGAGGTDVPAGR
jgi:segregation and condensation protein B